MTPPSEAKAALRRSALDARARAHASVTGDATRHLKRALAAHVGRPLSGYAPIRTEIDPTPAMAAHDGPVCLPVIDGPDLPLRFRLWTPGCAMTTGPFGARVPADGDWIEPEVLIVPLVGFDADGGRLGYGGGYYDRTLARLRAARPTLAIGFAYAAQRLDAIPQEDTDAPLDLVVTEGGILSPGSSLAQGRPTP